MDALFYFLFWALVLFLMMRFGCGAHVMGHGHGSKEPKDSGRGSELRWIPPESDRDPVCGKVVATATAKPSIHDGVVYYFCSRDCRERFEAAPAQYVHGVVAADTINGGLERRAEDSHV